MSADKERKELERTLQRQLRAIALTDSFKAVCLAKLLVEIASFTLENLNGGLQTRPK
jgi:hypothetical protein